MEAEQPNSGNSCLINRKICKPIKEIKNRRKCWIKEKLTEKIKEPGPRRESLFHEYGKTTRHRVIKSRLNYLYTAYHSDLTISALNRFRNNPDDHLVQPLLFVNC